MSQARLYRQLVDTLQQAIRAGRYPAGAYLPSERELAKQFTLSRSSVREAMIALEVLGWIEVRGGSGALVLGEQAQSALFDVQTAAQAAPIWSARDWFQARRWLEPEAAALTARHQSQSALAAIKAAFLQSVAEDMAGQGACEGARLFYLEIGKGCQNQVVTDLMTALLTHPQALDYLREQQQKLAQHHPFHAQQERLALLSALECGDENNARYRMRGLLMMGDLG